MGNTEIFERMAAGYDTPERIHIARVAADAIRAHAADAKDKTAVDFGCGTGLVGMNLLEDFKTMLFLDSSPNMINRIQQKIAEFHIPNADTLCLDLEQEAGAELKADYIFMAQVLLHIPEVEPVLTRLYEALHPGGHLLIVDFDKNEHIVSDLVHNGFDQRELISLMKQIGFTEVNAETIYTGKQIFMNQDASMFILDAHK